MYRRNNPVVIKIWGPFTCDTFADNKNKKVSIFFSRFFTPGTSGVDAFAYDWSKYNNWIVSPVHLISRTISHMRMCKARGTLVIPKWKSAVFWPMIIMFLLSANVSQVNGPHILLNKLKMF
jgi:hypothetical protein